jgi:drug/metabolite transporter (DMT)-like permease
MRIRQIALFLLVGLIWGSEWVAMSSMDAPPLRIFAFRYAAAAVVLGIVIVVRRIPFPDSRTLGIAALTGVTLLGIPSVLLTWGSNRLSPGLLVVILAMTPLIAALFEFRASGALLTALIGGIAGTTLIASQALSFGWMQWPGAAAVLVSAVLVAASTVAIKRRLSVTSPVLIAAIQFAAATAFVCLASLAFERNAHSRISLRAVSIELSVALLADAVAFPLYYSLFASMESFQLTATQWLVTVVGLAEGLIVMEGIPSWRIVAGSALVVASLVSLLRIRAGDDAPQTLILNL